MDRFVNWVWRAPGFYPSTRRVNPQIEDPSFTANLMHPLEVNIFLLDGDDEYGVWFLLPILTNNILLRIVAIVPGVLGRSSRGAIQIHSR